MQNIYDLIFSALKNIENQNDPKRRGGFSFSAHGKSAAHNLKFRFQRGDNPHGQLTWTPVSGSLGAGGNTVQNTITDEDIQNVQVQCEKVEINPYWAERVVLLFKAMQGLGLLMPTFQVQGYHPSWRSGGGYALKVKGWLHSEEGAPLGELELEVHAFPMGQYEKSAHLLEKANAAREAKAVTDFVEVADRLPLNRAQIDEAARAAVPLGIAEKQDVVVLGSSHNSLTSLARMGGIGHIPNA